MAFFTEVLLLGGIEKLNRHLVILFALHVVNALHYKYNKCTADLENYTVYVNYLYVCCMYVTVVSLLY